MRPTELNLDAYLSRIGYGGDRYPTISTLNALAAAHPRAIPFENLDPFLGTPNQLELSALQHKLVDGGRGGYCFEQNLLLHAALVALGFVVTPLAGRVLWGAPEHAITRRSHMLLLVDVEGQRRIIDVGFGGMTLTGTLRLELDTVQQTPLEAFRLVDLDGDYALQARIDDGWRTTYRFDLGRQYPIDYEAPNWYLSTWPQSPFVTTLMAARSTDERRYGLSGRRLRVHHRGGPSEERELCSATELRHCLERDFLINIEHLPQLDAAFARLPGA